MENAIKLLISFWNMIIMYSVSLLFSECNHYISQSWLKSIDFRAFFQNFKNIFVKNVIIMRPFSLLFSECNHYISQLWLKSIDFQAFFQNYEFLYKFLKINITKIRIIT